MSLGYQKNLVHSSNILYLYLQVSNTLNKSHFQERRSVRFYLHLEVIFYTDNLGLLQPHGIIPRMGFLFFFYVK